MVDRDLRRFPANSAGDSTPSCQGAEVQPAWRACPSLLQKLRATEKKLRSSHWSTSSWKQLANPKTFLTGDCCLPAPWGSLPLTSIQKAGNCLQVESLAAANHAKVCSWQVYVCDCASVVHEQLSGPANDAEGIPHHDRHP